MRTAVGYRDARAKSHGQNSQLFLMTSLQEKKKHIMIFVLALKSLRRYLLFRCAACLKVNSRPRTILFIQNSRHLLALRICVLDDL